ncbi:hypothetical protein Rhe02_46670 [Rhizocola hellebori]|uniref:Polyketide cyclase n=1 Tax=Rhizocola hellebori TaxID=1392758 RepID=A0A8J3Q9U6_9ACTN|nr:SRPBCC family protein [Rhizocola hellebori]GIH06600.1 hypothetical protein Rhe02_46670 [Rhizocola hellebori]
MWFETSVDIAAPAQRVWQALADVERWPSWTTSMTSVTPLDPGALAVGHRVKIKQPRLPTAVWTVDELTPGQSFSWTNRSIGIVSIAEHRLSTVDKGTRVVLAIRQTGPLAAVLSLLAGNLTRRYVRTEAAGLKRLCESAG